MVLRHEVAVLCTIKGVLAVGAEPVRPPARPRTPPTRRPAWNPGAVRRCDHPRVSRSCRRRRRRRHACEGQPQSVVRWSRDKQPGDGRMPLQL